jgi:hypothetical protein
MRASSLQLSNNSTQISCIFSSFLMMIGPSIPLFLMIILPEICLLGNSGRWHGCCALLLHAHAGLPQDGIVPEF